MQGAILLRSNRIEEAIPYLMRASRAADDNPEFLFDLANAQLMNAEFESALANAKQFCGIRPNDRRGLSILTSSAISSDKPGEAMGPVRLFVERYPRDANRSNDAGRPRVVVRPVRHGTGVIRGNRSGDLEPANRDEVVVCARRYRDGKCERTISDMARDQS